MSDTSHISCVEANVQGLNETKAVPRKDFTREIELGSLLSFEQSVISLAVNGVFTILILVLIVIFAIKKYRNCQQAIRHGAVQMFVGNPIYFEPNSPVEIEMEAMEV